jgi:hypothetical protein
MPRRLTRENVVQLIAGAKLLRDKAASAVDKAETYLDLLDAGVDVSKMELFDFVVFGGVPIDLVTVTEDDEGHEVYSPLPL